MTCLIEAHYQEYQRTCGMCKDEMKECMERGTISKAFFDNWMAGKEKFSIA